MVKLKYLGTGEYIPMIPNRDLTDYDILTITTRDKRDEQELIDELCSHGLYKVVNEHICAVCEQPFKSSKALIKHELKHIAEANITGEKNNNDNSTDST